MHERINAEGIVMILEGNEEGAFWTREEFKTLYRYYDSFIEISALRRKDYIEKIHGSRSSSSGKSCSGTLGSCCGYSCPTVGQHLHLCHPQGLMWGYYAILAKAI